MGGLGLTSQDGKMGQILGHTKLLHGRAAARRTLVVRLLGSMDCETKAETNNKSWRKCEPKPKNDISARFGLVACFRLKNAHTYLGDDEFCLDSSMEASRNGVVNLCVELSVLIDTSQLCTAV